jgi:hypothetical protein
MNCSGIQSASTAHDAVRQLEVKDFTQWIPSRVARHATLEALCVPDVDRTLLEPMSMHVARRYARV